MNQVTDANLSIAVYNAGCTPSLLSDDINEAIKFFETTQSHDFILSTNRTPNERELDYIVSLKPKYIETYIKYNVQDPIEDLLDNKIICSYFDKLRGMGSKILIKTFKPLNNPSRVCDLLVIKGRGAAGTNNKDMDVLDMLDLQLNLDHDISVIASGAITTGQTIDRLLTAGAVGVSLGTLFALTKESSIDPVVKIKLLSSKISDIVNVSEVEKNAIILGELIPNDDPNLTRSLTQGTKNNGGLLYLGHGIEDVKEIVTVETLVRQLVKESRILSMI
jgi:hypothetical protein